MNTSSLEILKQSVTRNQQRVHSYAKTATHRNLTSLNGACSRGTLTKTLASTIKISEAITGQGIVYNPEELFSPYRALAEKSGIDYDRCYKDAITKAEQRNKITFNSLKQDTLDRIDRLIIFIDETMIPHATPTRMMRGLAEDMHSKGSTSIQVSDMYLADLIGMNPDTIRVNKPKCSVLFNHSSSRDVPGRLRSESTTWTLKQFEQIVTQTKQGLSSTILTQGRSDLMSAKRSTRSVMAYVTDNPGATAEQVSENVGIAVRSAQACLTRYFNLNVLSRVKQGKTFMYTLCNDLWVKETNICKKRFATHKTKNELFLTVLRQCETENKHVTKMLLEGEYRRHGSDIVDVATGEIVTTLTIRERLSVAYRLKFHRP